MNVGDLYPEVVARLGARPQPDNRVGAWLACCPAHEDRRPSLSLWLGANGCLMLRCFANCRKEAILAAAGLHWTDLFPRQEGQKHNKGGCLVPSETYDYVDLDGRIRYQACRVELATGDKTFYLRSLNVEGQWVKSMDGVERIPYRLPQLVESHPRLVFVVEGERKANVLAELGFAATCNAGGAGKWESQWSARWLSDRPVVLVPDHDEPGYRHVAAVAGSLVMAGCPSIILWRWPDTTDKGWDIWDDVRACRRAGDSDEAIAAMIREQVVGQQCWMRKR